MATQTTEAGHLNQVLRSRRPSPRVAQAKRTFYFLSRSTLAMVGLGILLAMIGLAIYAPFFPAPATALVPYCGTISGNPDCTICTYSNSLPAPPAPNCFPVYQDLQAFVGPTVSVAPFALGPLPLGSLSTEAPDTPEFFSISEGLIKGSMWTLGISASIVTLGAVIGLFLGAFSGFRGGASDEVIMRTTDIFLSIPGLLLVLVLLAVLETAFTLNFDQRILVLVFAFVVTWWPTYARIVRSQVFVTREQKYVEAARASGAKTPRLLFRHIIPNSIYPVFVQMALDVGAIPLLLGAIVFLGFQIWPTEYFPEWGTMSALSIAPITSAIETCSTAIAGQGTCLFPWWQLLFPGLAVFLFAISVNFFGDGLRDALDPRLRR